MARTNGPTKGLVVINFPPNAESYIFEMEPINITDSNDLNAVLDGTRTLEVKIVKDDAIPVKYAEVSLCEAAGGP